MTFLKKLLGGSSIRQLLEKQFEFSVHKIDLHEHEQQIAGVLREYDFEEVKQDVIKKKPELAEHVTAIAFSRFAAEMKKLGVILDINGVENENLRNRLFDALQLTQERPEHKAYFVLPSQYNDVLNPSYASIIEV